MTATLLRVVPILQYTVPRLNASLGKTVRVFVPTILSYSPSGKAMVQALFTPLAKTLYRANQVKEKPKILNGSPFASASGPAPFETMAPDYIQSFILETQMYMDHLPGKTAVDVMRNFFAELVKDWEDLILGKSAQLDKSTLQWGEDDWEWIVGDMEVRN